MPKSSWTETSPVNLIVNGGFAADGTYATGWTLADCTVAITSGACVVTATADGGRIYQTISGLRPSAEYYVGVSIDGGATALAGRIYTTGGAQNFDQTFTTTDSAVVGGVVRTDASGTAIVLSLSVVTSGDVVTYDDAFFFTGNVRFWATHNALDMWRHHTDASKIDGGNLYTGSVPDAALATDFLTATEHTAIGDSAPHHTAVTIGANLDGVASLTTQALNLDQAPSSDTYNAAVSQLLKTDADGGLRVDHGEVGNVSGATEGNWKVAGTVTATNLAATGQMDVGSNTTSVGGVLLKAITGTSGSAISIFTTTSIDAYTATVLLHAWADNDRNRQLTELVRFAYNKTWTVISSSGQNLTATWGYTGNNLTVTLTGAGGSTIRGVIVFLGGATT